MECQQETVTVMSPSALDRYLCIYGEEGIGKETLRMEYYRYSVYRGEIGQTCQTLTFNTIHYVYD